MAGGWEDLNWMQRMALGGQGITGEFYNNRLAGQEALTARTFAEADSIEAALRRQQADEDARNLLFAQHNLTPIQGNAFLQQQDIMAALDAQKAQRLKTTQLGILTEEMKKTPLQREQESWEALFGGLQGAMKNVFGSPEEMQDYAQTTQAIQMAQQADAYQRDQAIEQALARTEAMTGVPVTLAAKRDAAGTFDSLTQRFGVSPDMAMGMVGQQITASSLGMPAQPGFGRGMATLPQGGVPTGFGASAFEASRPEPDLFQKLNALLGTGQASPTLASVKARINKPLDARDAQRIGLLLRSEGILSAKDLEALPEPKLQLLWQRIEGGL